MVHATSCSAGDPSGDEREGAIVRGVALPVGTNHTVRSPNRGDIPVDVRATGPCLIELKEPRGRTRVLRYLSGEDA